MWFGIVVCVIVLGLGCILDRCIKAEMRDAREAQDKEERDRASGALPYDYVGHTKKRGEK